MADEPSNFEDAVRRALLRAEATRRQAIPIPVTDSAYAELSRRISTYIGDLVDTFYRIAKRSDSPEVSAADVRRASERLSTRSGSRRTQTIGSIGGLLLGAALGNVLQSTGSPSVMPESVVLTFVCGVIGSAMMVYGYLRD